VNTSQKQSAKQHSSSLVITDPHASGLVIDGGQRLMAMGVSNIDQLLHASEPIRFRMLVTPEMAKRWLDANTKNRKPTDGHWLEIAIDMEQCRWKYNGASIKFGKDGVLLDGQHRLMACVESRTPFDTDVVFGLDPGVLDTIDTNVLPRTAAHIAQLEGVENATGSSALAYLLLVHEKHGIHRVQNVGCKPTKTEVIARVKADPRVAPIAGRATTWARRLVQPRVVAFCYYLFSQQDTDKAEQFVEEFSNGQDIGRGDPVYYLRERMALNARSKAKLPMKEIIALFFKAWIAYRDNKRLFTLRWRSSAEDFPQI
jgi:hypothetical protein